MKKNLSVKLKDIALQNLEDDFDLTEYKIVKKFKNEKKPLSKRLNKFGKQYTRDMEGT